MKSVYSHGQVQKDLVANVLEPGKDVLNAIAEKRFAGGYVGMAMQVIRDLQQIPEPTRENTTQPNALILLDIRDECFRHFNLPKHYLNIFRLFFNFVIGKLGYDNFYHDVVCYVLGEMVRRGWQFPGHNRPSSVLWHTIPSETRARLTGSIKDNYAILQDRLKVIQEKLGDSPEGRIHRESRYEQFAQRVLTDFEREVIAWR